MSKSVVLYQEEEKQQITEISEGKLQQMYRESLGAFSQGVMFGFKADFYKAFSLWNIKENSLHVMEELGWEAFLHKLGITQRSAQRYIRIAERIREMIKASSGSRVLPSYITQKDFNATFEPFFANGKQTTMRGLAQSSVDLETFQKYLSGADDLEDKDAIKLLNSRNKKTAEQKEREEREAIIAAETSSNTNTFFRSEAAARGYVWDEDKKTYTNPDGSELNDRQLTEFTDAVDALRVWSAAEQAISEAKAKIDHARAAHEPEYRRYLRHAPDNSFRSKVQEKFEASLRLLNVIDEDVRGLFVSDDNAA